MKVVVAGGTGFLGRALVEALVASRHAVVLLSRDVQARPGAPGPSVARIRWRPDGSAGDWSSALDGADAVVNLAGASIAGRRWSPRARADILESRLLATRSLVEAMAGLAHPPPVFLSASATGFYGTSDDRILTEQSGPGLGFLAEVCIRWEEEARGAERTAGRVVLLRTGLVLARQGGALTKMALPFRLMVGGAVGDGRQFVSWIHLADWVGLVTRAVEGDVSAGPINLTAPAPVTNREFSAHIAEALHRPDWLSAPAFALRIVLGQMADELLLGGQRVLPSRALELGYQFRFPTAREALCDLLGRRTPGASPPSV